MLAGCSLISSSLSFFSRKLLCNSVFFSSFQFTDMLLCCTPVRFIQGKTHKVSARINLEGMQINEVKNPTVPFAFSVDGCQKSIEFATK